jgi:hypothetical protein
MASVFCVAQWYSTCLACIQFPAPQEKKNPQRRLQYTETPVSLDGLSKEGNLFILLGLNSPRNGLGTLFPASSTSSVLLKACENVLISFKIRRETELG